MAVINKATKGAVIVISGPSGVGKGTVCNELRAGLQGIEYSVSATTRKPREGEQEGVHYFYKTQSEFDNMVKNNEFIEWAGYVNNSYGTPRAYVEDKMSQGKFVLLEIDVQGALQIQKSMASDAVFIFLLPPDIEELRRRIIKRASETEESLAKRMEQMEEEMKLIELYDYCVVNDDLAEATKQIEAIIIAESCRVSRNKIKYESILINI